MKRLVYLMVILQVFITSCNDQEAVKNASNTEIAADSTQQSFIPVTEFFKGQILELKNLELAPLKVVTHNGKADSSWIKREDIAGLAVPFMQPVIDSQHMARFYQVRSFLDQTVNAFTFTYEPKGPLPDTLNLQRWDVFVDPESNLITRIYLVKKYTKENEEVTEQLTWKTGNWFKITTISERKGSPADIKEEQVTWKF